MELIKSHFEFARFGIEYNLKQAGIDVRDERGVIATEYAIALAGGAVIAAALLVILLGKAESNANAIPDTIQAG